MRALPPPDATPADAAEPPKLGCEPGEQVIAAPAPEPTWYCARLSDGVRQGPFFTLFPDGTIAITGAYKDGKLDGKWTRRYPGGAIAEEGMYAAGQKDGHWRQLSATGQVIGEYDLHGGTGTEKQWFDDGPLFRERALRAGVPHGTYKQYDHDGMLAVVAKYWLGKLDDDHFVGSKPSMRLEEHWRKGTRVGTRQFWQFWELVIDEAYDDKGKLDGPFTIWRDQAKKIPRVQGTYDHGKRTGTWTWFDRMNNKEREGDYSDGKKTGIWQEWFEMKLVSSGTYTDGKPDGEFVSFDKNGNELGRFTIKDGTGMMETFYANKKTATKTHLYQGVMDGGYVELTQRIPQKIVVEGHYANDHKHGSWKEWTELPNLTLQPTLEQHWKRGRLDGAVKKFVDGKVVEEATFKDGKVDGAYTEYRNGKPSLVGQYADDHKTGTWIEYDDGGAVVLTATYKDGLLDGPWRQLISGAVVEGQMAAGRRIGAWTRTERTGAVQKTTYKTP